MRISGPFLLLTIFILSTAGSTDAPAQGLRGSYVDLKGARLKRFEKTEAASEARRPVAIKLPARLLTDGSFERLGRSKVWLTLLHRGVRYYVRRDNAYFVQSIRKAGKNPKGTFTLKGQVKKLRWQGTKIWAVKIESLQVRAKRRGRSRRRAA